MKKKFRLLKESDYKLVLKNRRKIYTNNLVCYYKEDLRIENVKIGIIIPKKKVKRSVDRSYLKRIFWYINQKYDLNTFSKNKCIFFYNKFFIEKFYNKKIPIIDLETELKKIYSQVNKQNEINK